MGCLSSKEAPFDASAPVSLKHFNVQRMIGEGGFGKVKAVTKKGQTPETWYAMKVLQKATVVDKARVKEVFQERDLLTYLRHDRICNIYYSFQDDRHCYLVLDIALGGDLRYQLNHNENGDPFAENRAKVYCAQLILALDYCHSKGILHRDVKPENVLVQGDGWLKLTDFGISRKVDADGYCYSGSGTLGYMGPELSLSSRKHSFTLDWFALGVTLHEFLFKERPADDHRIKAAAEKLAALHHYKRKSQHSQGTEANVEVSEKVQKLQEDLEKRSMFKQTRGEKRLSKECRSFLLQCLMADPEQRLGAPGKQRLRDHPWFEKTSSFDFESVENGTQAVPFTPDISKMNAEPDADIRSVFIGGDEENRLRSLSPEEQAFFRSYSYDFENSNQPVVFSARENVTESLSSATTKEEVGNDTDRTNGSGKNIRSPSLQVGGDSHPNDEAPQVCTPRDVLPAGHEYLLDSESEGDSTGNAGSPVHAATQEGVVLGRQ